MQSTVFDDLAHRIVHSTTLSLITAASSIATRASPTDASLFLIKHLLLLKQQIVAFDIEFVTPETDLHFDFASVSNTFWELRARGGLFNPRNLVRLVGGGLMPRVVENMLDAKAELDARLRGAIGEFTGAFAGRMTAAIANAGSAAKGGQGNDVKALATQTAKVREAVEKEVPFLRQKLDAYIEDARTRETLVAAVLERVVEVYEEWWGVMAVEPGKARGTNGTGKAKGKGRESDVWDPDAFAEWGAGVFKVGRLGLGIMEDEGEEGGRRESMSEGTGTGTGYGRSGST